MYAMAKAAPNDVLNKMVTVKVTLNGSEETRRFELPLKDFGPYELLAKLRETLQIPQDNEMVLERYSDSAGSFITLDSSTPAKPGCHEGAAWCQLGRAAKAKGKLRLRVSTYTKAEEKTIGVASSESPQSPRAAAPIANAFYPMASLALKTTGSQATSTPSPKGRRYFWPLSDDVAFSEDARTKFEIKHPAPQHVLETKSKDRGSEEAPVPNKLELKSRRCPASAAGQSQGSPPFGFFVQCNKCRASMPDTHWHCGICDGGDYDLCLDCVREGATCDGKDHWMIKRTQKGGKLINSETETLCHRKTSSSSSSGLRDGAIKECLRNSPSTPVRTCNHCLTILPEQYFVHCNDCDDYDLCMSCHNAVKHGHNPGHTFAVAVKHAILDARSTKLLASGRGVRHWAVCDGCDKDIFGTRHKCLNCPDWDYCADCVTGAHHTHPNHRFVALHEPLKIHARTLEVHRGITCDGPLCKDKSTFIRGDRFKCAVCHDTDFCASCEALPGLSHNRTHPLIKFKTEVRNVSVSTFADRENGEPVHVMGDASPQMRSASTETHVTSTNAATQVQTIAEIDPAGHVHHQRPFVNANAEKTPLQAHFVRDTITDGTLIAPNARFTQTWTLRNQGERAWPAGCKVCFVGGDSMLDMSVDSPSSIHQLKKAVSSNAIGRAVAKGEEVDFTIRMRTPDRECKVISYWRLKTPDGVPFGHRLWCDVNVRQAVASSSPQSPAMKTGTVPSNDTSETTLVNATPNGHPQPVPATRSEAQARASQMIFPKLEKESPVSSQLVNAGSSAPQAAAPVAVSDLADDVESLGMDDNESSDGGFLTDEEYDLIASGDEMEAAKNGKK